MTFLYFSALAVALLIAVPVAAHLLRRGRAQEREFPPAHLVPPSPPVARQRSRLEDRGLLAVRGLLIAGLAALGAVPLVRCSHLSLARESGASVALAIVLDDSASMRVEVAGRTTRFDRSLRAARELLTSAREGDAIAIVLAGRPARLALAATTDLAAARAILNTLQVADRATDLANAVKLARSSLAELPHVDQRVVVLGDLAGDELPTGSPPLWIPLPELARLIPDCGVARADRRGSRVTVEVSCSAREAAAGRRLEVLVAEPAPAALASAAAHPVEGTVVGSAPIAEQVDAQTVVVDVGATVGELDVRLTGSDAERHDDQAPVAPEASATSLGVVADPASASAATGGPPILEQALRALESGAVIRPLTLLPDEAASLNTYSALILDDPSGLGPEAREAIDAWLERGGVALALLGPSVGQAELGATLAPFVAAAVNYSATKVPGIDPSSAASLGPEAAGLAELAPRGRVALEGSVPAGARVLMRWADGGPFLIERDVGRGLLVTASLPSAPSVSDFALRPGFLALLSYVIDETWRRHGSRVTSAGTPWVVRGNERLRVTPPTGAPVEVSPERDAGGGEPRALYTPSERGRYRLEHRGETETRIVTLDPEELSRRPRDPAELGGGVRAGGGTEWADVSREAALGVLLLFTLELVTRAWSRWRDRRRTPRVRREIPEDRGQAGDPRQVLGARERGAT